MLEGSPELVIPHIVERFGITEISVSRKPGFYESQTIEFLEERPSIPIVTHRVNSLFAEDEPPMPLEDLPGYSRHFVGRWKAFVRKLWTRSSIYRRHQRHEFDAILKATEKPPMALPLPEAGKRGPALETVYLR